jgi:hypothetical protein
VDEARFIERLVHFCVGSTMRSFPQRLEDLDILMQSICAELPKERVLSEAWVNLAIKRWLAEVATKFEIDHVNIRRRLVDYGYLTRSRDCRHYYRTAKIVDVPDSRWIVRQAQAERAVRLKTAQKRVQAVARDKS